MQRRSESRGSCSLYVIFSFIQDIQIVFRICSMLLNCCHTLWCLSIGDLFVILTPAVYPVKTIYIVFIIYRFPDKDLVIFWCNFLQTNFLYPRKTYFWKESTTNNFLAQWSDPVIAYAELNLFWSDLLVESQFLLALGCNLNAGACFKVKNSALMYITT